MRTLLRRSITLEPTIWIGKNGVTEELLGQISAQLKSRQLVKVKVHSGQAKSQRTDLVARRVSESTGSTLIDVRGRTFTIYRPKTEERKSLGGSTSSAS